MRVVASDAHANFQLVAKAGGGSRRMMEARVSLFWRATAELYKSQTDTESLPWSMFYPMG